MNTFDVITVTYIYVLYNEPVIYINIILLLKYKL